MRSAMVLTKKYGESAITPKYSIFRTTKNINPADPAVIKLIPIPPNR